MDLYEALKGGTSEDELQKSFDEELAKARMRIAAEKKKEEEENLKKVKQQQVDHRREALAESILEYADSLFGSDILAIYPIEDVEEELKNFEKEVDNLYDLLSTFNDLLKKAEVETPSLKVKKSSKDADDIIIQSFLEGLKY